LKNSIPSGVIIAGRNISQTPILLANTVHYKAMYNSVLTPGRKPPC
jgi:hypothetical protein